MIELDREAVLSQFDELVSIGDLQYSEPSSVTQTWDKGFALEFRVAKAIAKKPQLGDTEPALENKNTGDAKTASDIDHEDPRFIVAEITPTHRLILNKYCVFRPQYLLLPHDPSNRQDEPLSKADFVAAWSVLSSLKTPHYIIYNCGPEGGSSRRHKHMQVFESPRSNSNDLALLGDRPEDIAQTPYQCYFERIPAAQFASRPGDAVQFITERQHSHLREARGALGHAAEDMHRRIPHNVILTQNWLMTIPRRVAQIDILSPVSAAGMVGLVWLTGDDQLVRWKELGPAQVLASVGVSRTTGKADNVLQYTEKESER